MVKNFQTKEVIQTGNSVGCLCHINIINQGHEYTTEVWHDRLCHPSSQTL